MPPIFGFYLNYLFVLFLIVLHGDGKISEASSCAGVYKFVSCLLMVKKCEQAQQGMP